MMKKVNRRFIDGKERFFTHEGKEIILIDMDDVIVDLNEVWVNLYNTLYQDTLTKKDFVEWDVSKVVKKECGPMMYDLLKHPGLFLSAKPMKDAVEVLERLSKQFEIYLVTDSPEGHHYGGQEENSSAGGNPTDDKRTWVKRHLPFIKKENFIATKSKFMVTGSLLFDDGPHNLEAFRHMDRHVICMEQPWNKNIDASIPKVSGWKEFERKVLTLLEIPAITSG